MIERLLEQYTIEHPHEVLIVTAEIGGKEDQIAIFKCDSSSLMHSTAFDTDIPVLPDGAKITCIDRVLAPYNPKVPRYLQRGLTWEAMLILVSDSNSTNT
ncbi:MAG: hypothetical protein NVSMB70_06020 [Chamaesiphon sp.]